MRRRRGLRWLVVALVIAIGAYVVVDVVMLQYLESRGGNQIARTLAAEEASVALGGFPFLPGFITGGVGDVEVRVRGVSGPGGLRLQTLVVRADHVDFSPAGMFALARSAFASRELVTFSDAFGMFELGEDDLEEFLIRSVPLISSVEVLASGIEVHFQGEEALRPAGDPTDAGEPIEPARYLPQIRDGHLKLIATSLSQIPPQFREDAQRLIDAIQLPAIPAGLTADVRLGNGVIVVETTGPEVELTVGEGRLA